MRQTGRLRDGKSGRSHHGPDHVVQVGFGFPGPFPTATIGRAGAHHVGSENLDVQGFVIHAASAPGTGGPAPTLGVHVQKREHELAAIVAAIEDTQAGVADLYA